MKIKKLFLALSVFALLTLSVLFSGVKASAADKFIDNPHWQEISSAEADAKYQSGDKFIAMFYKPDCYYCNSIKPFLDNWMKTYGFDIYGINVSKYGVSSWASLAKYVGSNNTPYICLVENGNVTSGFRGDILMDTLASGLSEFLGFDISTETIAPSNEKNCVNISIKTENDQKSARKMLNVANKYRKENGKSELAYNYNLEEFAIKRAVEYSVYMDKNKSPSGVDYTTYYYGKGIIIYSFSRCDEESFEHNLLTNPYLLYDNFDALAVGHIRALPGGDVWVAFFCSKENSGNYTKPKSKTRIFTVPLLKDRLADASVSFDKSQTRNLKIGDTFDPKKLVTDKYIKSEVEGESSSILDWSGVENPVSFTGADGKCIVYKKGKFKVAAEGTGEIYGKICGKKFTVTLTIEEQFNLGTPVITVKAGSKKHSVKITISKTNDATKYKVYMSKRGDWNSELVCTLEKDGTKKRTVTINNLQPGDYYFYVKAVGEKRYSDGGRSSGERQSEWVNFVVK